MSARLKLGLIFIACAAPFVLGWAAWYFGWGTGTRGNYGELISPQPVPGAPFEELRGRWVLVMFDPANCGPTCQRKLYYLRQVRTALGKEQGRVERLWVITDDGQPVSDLLAAYPGMRLWPKPAEGFPRPADEHIYVVDPLGNLMLRFPRDPDPSRMLKDLQRLLRYSRVG